MEQELEQLEGTVEDIIYENTDNGYTVFEVSGGGVMTVVCGVVGELHAGETVICRGKYENHATYGRQFHAQECETDMPKDLEAVYAFLASRSLPYIGARTADKILDKFGAQALEILRRLGGLIFFYGKINIVFTGCPFKRFNVAVRNFNRGRTSPLSHQFLNRHFSMLLLCLLSVMIQIHSHRSF